MKKPDRFERMGERCTNRYIGTYIGGPEHAKEIATLLRREHAWMRRMVKKVEAWSCEQLAESDDVIAVILEQLTQRRK